MQKQTIKFQPGLPKTLVRACERYADRIEEVWDEGEDGIWIMARSGFWNRYTECLVIHEHTVKDCLWQLGGFEADPRPENKR